MQVLQVVSLVMGAFILLLLLINVIQNSILISKWEKSWNRLKHEFCNCVDAKTRLEWNQHKTVLCNDGKRRSINYVKESINERI